MTLMPTLFLIGGEGAAEIVGAVAFEVVAGAFDDEHYFLESYAVGAMKNPAAGDLRKPCSKSEKNY
jgi:hypothetical protein